MSLDHELFALHHLKGRFGEGGHFGHLFPTSGRVYTGKFIFYESRLPQDVVNEKLPAIFIGILIPYKRDNAMCLNVLSRSLF